jgi:Flp pilus assembly protein TadG
MRRSPGSLLRNNNGAVAATVALSLVGLLAVGGVAFDYARLASLDTELQDAADQAALAAATQLDGKADSATRAIAAAQGLLQNQARFGNDSCGINIETGVSNAACTAGGATSRVRILFYDTKANAEADTSGFAGTATNGATAKFVKVEVVERKAKYALTPIVAAFSSGSLGAAATAGLGSAICKVPPLMMCNPQETSTNLDFNVAAYKGVGIRLVQGGGNGSGAWAPGNFGYLESSLGNGASALEYSLGANNPPGNCLASDGVTTKPGTSTSVTDAINTRFDIFENGLTNSCNGGACSPSNNVRKDVVRPTGSSNFGFKTGSDPWDLPLRPYLPADTNAYPSPYPTSMGMPRDTCHAVSAAGTCSGGRIGNGTWDRDLYFFVNHNSEYTRAVAGTPDSNWTTIPSLAAYASANGYSAVGGTPPTIANITRYDVYKWEIAAPSLSPYQDHFDSKGKGTTYMNYATPQAMAGLAAGPNTPDRRLISMAVINCVAQDLHGQGKDVTVAKWVELFLVEPSVDRDRTSKGDIYVEVVRETNAGGAAPTNAQVVKRDVPYLVK